MGNVCELNDCTGPACAVIGAVLATGEVRDVKVCRTHLDMIRQGRTPADVR